VEADLLALLAAVIVEGAITADGVGLEDSVGSVDRAGLAEAVQVGSADLVGSAAGAVVEAAPQATGKGGFIERSLRYVCRRNERCFRR
jgi:hypothetical protein